MTHALEGKVYVNGKELDRLVQDSKEISLIRYDGHFQILRINGDSYFVELCTGNKTERYKIAYYVQKRSLNG